jgi:amidase/aspartyl-tRNA(Asn)/glutamyl-tRNA(Gln) amidotransferase subunit A
VAPLLGTEWLELDGRRLSARASLGLLAQPISCIGLPVVTVPVWLPQARETALPLGVQVIAALWREDRALAVAAALARDAARRTPVAVLA